MHKHLGILAVGLLALTGCSAAPAASETGETPAPSSPAAATAESKVFESICTDSPDDSTSNAVDLDQASLLTDGSLMFVTFSTVADVPTSGTVLYSISASSEDGNTAYQIGTKFQEGQEIANFVFDMSDATQENITNGAVAADKQVATRYPLSALEGLGDSFKWYATVSVDGVDNDQCGSIDDKTVFPNT